MMIRYLSPTGKDYGIWAVGLYSPGFRGQVLKSASGTTDSGSDMGSNTELGRN